MGPIPYTAVDAYAHRHGFDDPDQFADLLRAIRVCDGVLLEHYAKKQD